MDKPKYNQVKNWISGQFKMNLYPWWTVSLRNQKTVSLKHLLHH